MVAAALLVVAVVVLLVVVEPSGIVNFSPAMIKWLLMLLAVSIALIVVLKFCEIAQTESPDLTV